MHTVERLEVALAQAQKLGFQIRQEWLENGGGVCEFKGQQWLFLDLSQSAAEQLEQVREALRQQAARQADRSDQRAPPASAIAPDPRQVA